MKIKVRVADVQIEYDGETNLRYDPVVGDDQEALHRTITHMAEQARELLKDQQSAD